MSKKLLNQICIIMVSFRSKKKVEKTISNLNKEISIILVENSRDKSIKKEFEKKYKNLQVIIPKINGGQGYAFNVGAKKTNKKFLLFIDMDITLKDHQILKLIKKAIQIKKFGVLTPKIKHQSYKDLIINKKNTKFGLKKVIFNTGCVMLVSKNTFKKINNFDENIFLYYEENDFYKRCIDANYPVYMYDKVMVSNPKSKSIESKFNHEYLKIRNWHYCWSKFYYYKKHHGYLIGISKTFPNIIRSIKKIIFCVFNFKFKETVYYLSEIYGLFCSYLGLRSFYRMR